MKQTRKAVSRRDLIKGLGVVGLLPFTKVNQLLAATSAAPLRVLFVALQHGWGTSERPMTVDGADFSFPDGLDPFNSIKSQCTVVDGLMTLGQWGNNHDLSYADVLTAGVPFGMRASAFDSHMPLSLTPSIDYLLEEQSGLPTYRFTAGYRSWGVQYHPLSFDHNSSVLPFYSTAVSAYDSLFKGLTDGELSGEVAGVQSEEADMLSKVFQFVRAPAERQLDSVPLAEKNKLERYLLAVEHLQVKNAATVGYSGAERLSAIPENGQTKLQDLDSYLDMIKVGFANGLTETAVVGIGDIHGIEDFHHTHAHAVTDTWWDTRRDFSQSIVIFANALDQITDFDGNSLLDNTLIVLTGEVGDGTHNLRNKGHLMVGGGNHLNVGRVIKPAHLSKADAEALRREDINGALQPQLRRYSMGSSRTNADLFREIGNIAGLNLNEFGLPSQNRGDLLSI